jgi:hypothetical protein
MDPREMGGKTRERPRHNKREWESVRAREREIGGSGSGREGGRVSNRQGWFIMLLLSPCLWIVVIIAITTQQHCQQHHRQHRRQYRHHGPPYFPQASRGVTRTVYHGVVSFWCRAGMHDTSKDPNPSLICPSKQRRARDGKRAAPSYLLALRTFGLSRPVLIPLPNPAAGGFVCPSFVAGQLDPTSLLAHKGRVPAVDQH